MRKAILGALALASVGFAPTAATAETYVVRERVNRVLACYNRVYVEARVLVNTRGRLVRQQADSWEVTGDRWLRVREPATFIQTRRVIEPDHYTLVPC